MKRQIRKILDSQPPEVEKRAKVWKSAYVLARAAAELDDLYKRYSPCGELADRLRVYAKNSKRGAE